MTNTQSTPTNAPKKSYTKIIVVIVLILIGLLGLDYCKFHYVLGTAPVTTDTTIVVTPVDTIKVVVADTTKKDTTKKVVTDTTKKVIVKK